MNTTFKRSALLVALAMAIQVSIVTNAGAQEGTRVLQGADPVVVFGGTPWIKFRGLDIGGSVYVWSAATALNASAGELRKAGGFVTAAHPSGTVVLRRKDGSFEQEHLD